MAVVVFPMTGPGDLCWACQQPTVGHRLNGRWIGCRVDAVIGRDQETLARRLRLARLQTRVLKIHPWAVDVEHSSPA